MNLKNKLVLLGCFNALSIVAMANVPQDEDELFESPTDELLNARENRLYAQEQEAESFDDSLIGDQYDDSAPAMQSSSTTQAPSASSRGYYYMFPDQKGDYYTEVDFLYWTVSETGLYYALTKTEPVPGVGEVAGDGGSGAILGVGSRHDVEFDWTPAVRASMGYEFNNTPWYINAEYTYFNTHEKHTIDAPHGPFAYLTGLSLLQGTTQNCAQAVSKIHFQYQAPRLVFGASWHPLEKLGVHMEFGPKFSIVNQNWSVLFVGNGNPGTANENNTLKWSYWGGGLNLVLGLDANLGMGFGIDAGAGLSAVYGPFKSRYFNNRTPVGAPAFQTFSIKRSSCNEVLWESQLYTDLSWSYHLAEVAFRVALGYEFNVLNNINEQLRSDGSFDTVNSSSFVGNVSKPIYLHGLVAKFGVAF